MYIEFDSRLSSEILGQESDSKIRDLCFQVVANNLVIMDRGEIPYFARVIKSSRKLGWNQVGLQMSTFYPNLTIERINERPK